jgi:hypothetical protein
LVSLPEYSALSFRWVAADYISTDSVHPNMAGYAYIGRLCATGIRRAAADMLGAI